MIVTEFLKKVRSRLVSNQILNGILLGTLYTILAFVVVYYLGVFLPWQICLTIFVGVSAFYLKKIQRRLDIYLIAQRIDKENKLADTISTTAYIYEKIKQGLPPGDTHNFTKEKAEFMVKQLDLKKNSPIKVPKSSIASLLIGFFLLFSILYIHINGLDWKYQTKALPYTYSFVKKEVKKIEKVIKDAIESTEKKSENATKQSSKNNLGKTGRGSEAQEAEKNLENTTSEKNKSGDKSGSKEASENRNKPDSKSEQGFPQDSHQSQEQKEGKQGKEGNQNSSLGQKISNALGNALQKMKDMMKGSQSQDGKSGESQQGQGQQQDGKQNSNNQSDSNMASKEGKDGQSQQGQEGQGQQASQGEGKEGQNGEGKSGQGRSMKKGQGKGEEGKQGSGIGSDDGKKELKDQQDQDAMGKLNNIYGQRSKDMKGEATIEDGGSKNQTLNTQYSNSNATHTDKGGDIDRDEIPQDMADIVKNYMETIHNKGDKTPKKH